MAWSNGTLVGATEPVRAARFFRVQIPDVAIGVFSYCSGLQVEREVLEYAEGGENGYVHRLPGRMHHPNLLLSRGLTNETALLDWMLATKQPSERPTVTITLLDERGDVHRSWGFAHAFPVRWVGPTFAGQPSEVANETLEIAHSGLLEN